MSGGAVPISANAFSQSPEVGAKFGGGIFPSSTVLWLACKVEQCICSNARQCYRFPNANESTRGIIPCKFRERKREDQPRPEFSLLWLVTSMADMGFRFAQKSRSWNFVLFSVSYIQYKVHYSD